MKVNKSDWTEIGTQEHKYNGELKYYTISQTNLDPYTEYSYRVMSNLLDNGKPQPGSLPGPASKPVIPHCIGK